MGQGLLKKLLVGIQPPWGLTALGLRPDHDYVGSPKRHPHCIAGEVVPDWNCGEAIRGAGSDAPGRPRLTRITDARHTHDTKRPAGRALMDEHGGMSATNGL